MAIFNDRNLVAFVFRLPWFALVNVKICIDGYSVLGFNIQIINY